MKITKIEKQKKNSKRYNLYISGEFYCGLYEDTIIKYGIASGIQIDESSLQNIRSYDEYIYGKKIALDYLAYRIRTVSEICKKLLSKKLNELTISKVIDHLNKIGLLNDEDFARQLVKEKIKNKMLGRRMLQKKLFEKGIAKQTGDSVLNELLNSDTENLLAFKIYDKIKPKLKHLDSPTAKKKIYETLFRKGFNYDIINNVILKFNAENGE
ncbi:MAG: RecX family transcriptional regulator [Ignavibacteria bacterium]|nr:RecX family transcriptional regulator [Ignavibacteria bacterium]